MGNTHRVLLAMLLVSLVSLGCQSESSSPLGGGERTITSAAFDLSSDAAISAALDACNDNGDGQGTAASTRFGNAIRKYDSGGGTSEMLTLLEWEYERVDEGKWVCGEQDFEDIMTAMVNRVGLDIPITFDGGLCTNPEGCKLVSNDGCTGILTPNPAAKTYYISFEPLEEDPFVAKAPIFNSYPSWADVKVFDIDGNVVTGADFTGNPATVAIVTEGAIPVVEAGLALGHLKNAGTASEKMEILPPGDVGLELATCPIQTADAGFFDPIAALFRVTPLFAGGTTTKGLLSSFSPVGPIDPESDTAVEITPISSTLNDLQSVTLTATVSGVDGVDTQGGVYTAAAVTAGDPLHFLIDGAALDPVVTDANGQATLTLTCGDELPFGEHVIDVQYHATDIHAESATTDGDSPTGSATVNCATPFTLINFDRDPNNGPLKNGEIVNETYASQGVQFCRFANGGTQCSGNVFAVSDPNTGHFGSPPRVVSLSEGSSPISSTANGWVRALFDTAQNQVCVAVFPTAGTKKNSPQGAITARFTNGTSTTVTGQGKLVCVAKGNGRNAPLIQSVEFSGVNGVAKFDNLRFR